MSQLTKNTMAEFKGQIVDIFEDYLEEHNVTPDCLPNVEREPDDEDAAIIYGDDYDFIADEVQFQVDRYRLIQYGPTRNPQIISTAVNTIYERFSDVASKLINTDFALDADSECQLKEKIRQTFINWEVFE